METLSWLTYPVTLSCLGLKIPWFRSKVVPQMGLMTPINETELKMT